MTALFLADNPRVVMGGNNPPEPTPFELARDEIDGLFEEAQHWLDGSGVQSQADADGISKLLDLTRKARKRADESRKVENEPFDKGKAEVQARYNPILSRADLATETCKKALTPYLANIEAEKRALAEAARRDAEEKAAAAQAAVRAARDADLVSREQAELLLREAKRAETAASCAEKDRAHAKGSGRATTLRTTYRPEITDATAFARFCWQHHRGELQGFLLGIAKRLVDGGRRDLPGVTVHEDRVAV